MKVQKNIFRVTLVLALILGCSWTFLAGCDSKKNEAISNNSASNNTANNSSTATVEVEKEKEETKPLEKKKKEQNSNIPYFEKKKLQEKYSPQGNTPWKQSPGGSLSVSIEGKGENGAEEGIGKILLKNNKGEIYSFTLINTKKQNSPLFVEWANDSKVFVTIGYGHGTVAKGGNLYILDVNNNINEQVLKTLDNKQMVSKVALNGNKLTLNMYIYDDDNFNKGHKETWNINPFDINLEKSMEVKNEKGSTVYKIN